MTPRRSGICPTCRIPRRLRTDGTLGEHRQILADGYSRGGSCPSVGDKPDCCVGEQLRGDPNALHSFDCQVYQRMSEQFIEQFRKQRLATRSIALPLSRLPLYARVIRTSNGLPRLELIDPRRVTVAPNGRDIIIAWDPTADRQETP